MKTCKLALKINIPEGSCIHKFICKRAQREQNYKIYKIYMYPELLHVLNSSNRQ